MIDLIWFLLLWALGMILISDYLEEMEDDLGWKVKTFMIIFWPLMAVFLGIISLITFFYRKK